MKDKMSRIIGFTMIGVFATVFLIVHFASSAVTLSDDYSTTRADSLSHNPIDTTDTPITGQVVIYNGTAFIYDSLAWAQIADTPSWQSTIGDTASELRTEIAEGGGGDIVGLYELEGISILNADGPGVCSLGVTGSYLRGFIDTLTQVYIPFADTGINVKYFKLDSSDTYGTVDGEATYDPVADVLYIGTDGTAIELKQVPDSSAKAAAIDIEVLEALAVAEGASNGEILVYRPGYSPATTMVFESQAAGGGISSVKLRGTEIATDVTTIDFMGNDGWAITETPTGEINVSYSFVTDKIILPTEVTGRLTVSLGGLDKSSWTPYTFLYGNNVTAPVEFGPLTNGQIIVGQTSGAPVAYTPVGSDGVVVTTGAGTLDFSLDYLLNPIDLATAEITGYGTVDHGMTGLNSITDHAVMVGSGSDPVTPLTLGAGQIMVGTTSGDPVAFTPQNGTGITVSATSGSVIYNATLGTSIDSTEIPTGGISFSDIGENTATSGQVPSWNGSAWVPVTPSGDLLTELTNGDSAGFGFIPASGDSFNVWIDDDTTFISSPGKEMKYGEATGDLILKGSTWPADSGTADYVLATDGDGTLSWTAQTGGSGTALKIADYDSTFSDAAVTDLVFSQLFAVTEPVTDHKILLDIDTADAVANSEPLPVTGNAVYDFCETTQNYALNSELHTREHSMTGTSDHNATPWRVFYSNGSGDVAELALGADETVLRSNGAAVAPSFGKVEDGDLNLGADASAFNMLDMYGPTANRLWYSNGSGVMTALAAGTEGQVIKKGATAPEWGAESDPDFTDDNQVTIGDNVTNTPTITLDGPDGDATIVYDDGITGRVYLDKPFSVNGNITVSGMVDGVDLATFAATLDEDAEIVTEAELEDSLDNYLDSTALGAFVDSAATANGWAAPSSDSVFVKVSADSGNIGILNSDTVNAVMLVADTATFDSLKVTGDIDLPNGSISEPMLGASSVTYNKVAAGTLRPSNMNGDSTFVSVSDSIDAHPDTGNIQLTIWDPEGLTDTIPIFYADSTDYPSGLTILGLSCQTSVDGAYELKFFSFTAADPPVFHDEIDTLNVGASDQRASSETFEDADANDVDVGQFVYILTPSTDIDWLRITMRFLKQ